MIDQRGILDEEPFAFKVLKDNKLQIFWHDKPVMILKGNQSLELLNKLESAEGKDVQLLLAKVTGNFKHGNERLAKERSRR